MYHMYNASYTKVPKILGGVNKMQSTPWDLDTIVEQVEADPIMGAA